MVGQKIRLLDFQREFIENVYNNPAGTRTAILSLPRKSGKTALSASLLLLHLVGPEHVRNSQLYSAAQSRDQAALLFNLAAKMVRLNPDLNAFVGVRDTAKSLYCNELGTVYRALSADATTAYGLSVCFAVHDELGQVKGPRSELYDAIETGCAAHESPLSIIISTQAPTAGDLLSLLIDDSRGKQDPHTVLQIYEAPEDADPFDPEVIAACNPAWGIFQNDKEILKTAKKAKRMPSQEPSFRNLHLNQRVEANSPFISRTVWQENGADPFPFDDKPVWCGLDLSATTDLTAFVAVAYDGEKYACRPTCWLPQEGLYDKAKADRVPYDVWADQGFLETTPGATIEYEWVAHWLREFFDTHNVRRVAFDRWNFKFLKPWLEKAGFDESEIEKFEPFGQGYASMSPALRELEAVLLEKKLCHGNHPVLTMCMANAVVQTDPAGNRKMAKDRSSGRIDCAIALAMAIAAATGDETEEFVTGSLVAI